MPSKPCLVDEVRWTGLVYIQTTDLTLMDYLGISAGGSEAGPGTTATAS